MDEKYDVYVVVMPANERAFNQLNDCPLEAITDLAQDVDWEEASSILDNAYQTRL